MGHGQGTARRQQLAIGKDVSAIRDRQRFTNVVIGNQHPHTPPAQAGDQLLEIGNCKRINARKRLIEQQVTGTMPANGKRTGHLTTAPLAPRELKSLAALKWDQMEVLNQAFQSLLAQRSRRLTLLERQLEIFPHAEIAEDTGFLG
jgi:hypothetical protein